METKMRIKLYQESKKLDVPPLLLSDRLVEQATEFNNGPKEKHKGPMSLEVNLRDKSDVSKVIEYLNKVALDMPLESKDKPTKINKSLDKMLSDKEPLLDLKKTVLAKAKFQEDIVEALREYNFKFVHSQVLIDMNEDKPGLFKVKQNHDGYQFMIRLMKQAKDPSKDKWDTRLAFGIKIVGERYDKVQIYLWGEYDTTLKMPWKDVKKINFKKKERVIIFPEFMTAPERKKWRAENRKFDLPENAEKPQSEFYKRWAPHITVA